MNIFRATGIVTLNLYACLNSLHKVKVLSCKDTQLLVSL